MENAEPGLILLILEQNTMFCENIRATNPCGEQPLPPYGACLLGSVNLTKFVKKPFTEGAFILIGIIMRKRSSVYLQECLDNVVDVNGFQFQKSM